MKRTYRLVKPRLNNSLFSVQYSVRVGRKWSNCSTKRKYNSTKLFQAALVFQFGECRNQGGTSGVKGILDKNSEKNENLISRNYNTSHWLAGAQLLPAQCKSRSLPITILSWSSQVLFWSRTRSTPHSTDSHREREHTTPDRGSLLLQPPTVNWLSLLCWWTKGLQLVEETIATPRLLPYNDIMSIAFLHF